MERIVKIFNNFKEAEDDEILYEISLTPEERIKAAMKLREIFYGKDVPDVRDKRICVTGKKT